MSTRNESLHVYEREIKAEVRTSLSVLASLVPSGAVVLDLGCGSGALGEYLKNRHPCTVDGVTINESEAALARAHYDRVEVADLDLVDLPGLFAARRYDKIICADVLEHLKHPERVLNACRQLLKPDGEVLISIPNVAYAGLVAEMLEGRFTYREEGLLDRTHLRFFTRQSLLAFLAEHGFGVQSLDTVTRDLDDSEFRTAFDRLPPSVARFLLAVPDALTYQFIACARPDIGHGPQVGIPDQLTALAFFTMRLYLGGIDGYREDRKLDTKGVIGNRRQTLSFRLPDHLACTSLRLDPADRPGFLHLFRLSLKDRNGGEVWCWQADRHPMERLTEQAHHEMLLNGPTAGAFSAQILLHGDDPWIELPVSHALSAAQGGTLEVEVGWPMSADYLCLAEKVQSHGTVDDDRLRALAAELSDARALSQALQIRWDAQLKEFYILEEREHLLARQNAALTESRQALRKQQRELQDVIRSSESARQDALRALELLRSSRVFRYSRPLAKLKARLGHLTTAAKTPGTVSISTAPATPPIPRVTVDIIVPVYKGLADTQRCILSVLAHPQQTPWRLIVINDCSPEPEVTDWLRQIAALHTEILLLENPSNQGFVATVNRGMGCSDNHDVLLLNSDTEVANDWLDRLVRAAYSHGRVATVTPFSNNATICSYPRFCGANEMPAGYDTASLDALFAAAVPGLVIDVPTGVGFCMFIRRDCLAEVGLFDVANFGKGYGEENDFCRRAFGSGWRNLHALDTFVRHAGGVSFGASKSAREQAALKTLQRLYPDYDRAVHDFIAQDPARQARLAVDQQRLAHSKKPVILAVMHNRGGGTVRHAMELAAHLREQAIFFMLRPIDDSKVVLEWLGTDEGFSTSFFLPREFDDLVQMLKDLGVCHVHYHHLIGHSQEVLHLPQHLGVDYDFTAHDYYSICPQVSLTDGQGRYCGERGLEDCQQCVQKRPAPGNGGIEQWRQHHGQFLSQARYVLAPSSDTMNRLARYLPGCDLRVAPHTDLPEHIPLPTPAPTRLADKAPLKVAILGALSDIKGADLLEQVALAAAQAQVPVEFHLLGFAYRPLQTQPKASLTIHGRYDEADLPRLLDWLKPDLLWFPAQWPETYSYTLSAALSAGLPVLTSDLGAFKERLEGRIWSWSHPWNIEPSACVELMLHLRAAHFVTGITPDPFRLKQNQLLGGAQPIAKPDWQYEQAYLAGLTSRAATLISAERMFHFRCDRARPESVSIPKEPVIVKTSVRQRWVQLPGVLPLARLFPRRWREALKRRLKL